MIRVVLLGLLCIVALTISVASSTSLNLLDLSKLQPATSQGHDLEVMDKRSAAVAAGAEEANKENHVTVPPPAVGDVAAGGHAFVHSDKRFDKSFDFEEISKALKQREQAPSDNPNDRDKRQKLVCNEDMSNVLSGHIITVESK
jgi:hypothetical protein